LGALSLDFYGILPSAKFDETIISALVFVTSDSIRAQCKLLIKKHKRE